MINPIQGLEMIGKLAKASALVADLRKIDKLDENGKPIPDGNPDIDALLAECRNFIVQLNDVNHSAQKLMLMQASLVDEVEKRLKEVK